MYVINTSDGTSVTIESGVYTVTNGGSSVVTDAQGFNNWLLWWGLQADEKDT